MGVEIESAGQPAVLAGTPSGISLFATGSVAAPAAGATVATLGVIAAGTYDCTMTVWITGTVAAADTNNVQIKGGTVGNLGSIGGAGSTGVPVPVVTRIRLTLSASQSLFIAAAAAASAGTTYSAVIVATPVA